MREIKFRAWNIANNEWIEGRQLTSLYDFFIYGKELEIKVIPTSKSYMYLDDEGFAEGAKFMQYTGLKDKNGKEIYEGDIIKTDNGIFALEWSEGSMEPFGAYYDYPCIEWNIIGNIYQNPELLEKASE